jgi:hypothetical protein
MIASCLVVFVGPFMGSSTFIQSTGEGGGEGAMQFRKRHVVAIVVHYSSTHPQCSLRNETDLKTTHLAVLVSSFQFWRLLQG